MAKGLHQEQFSEEAILSAAIGDFESRLPPAIEKAAKKDLHGLAAEAMEEMPLTPEEVEVLATRAVLLSLEANAREALIKCSRATGSSHRFGDQALVALSNFNRLWPALKKRLEEKGIQL